MVGDRGALTTPVPRSDNSEWRDRFGLVAGITERGPSPGFSLGFWTDEPVGTVMERWRAFREAFRPGFVALRKAHQVHGSTVLWHQGVAPGWHVADAADGHLTQQPGILLAVTVADCVPVYLTTSDGRAFGLVHAGWRGTAEGVLEAGVKLLTTRSGSPASEVVIHLGVSICGACYEVGPEVALAVEGRRTQGRSKLDLRAVLARRAEALGVGGVTISPLCTSCDHDRFFSHRASAGRDGRMVAYLGRPLGPGTASSRFVS